MASPVIAARLSDALHQRLEQFVESAGESRTAVIILALESFLSSPPAPLPLPTESERSGMRLKVLSLLRRGGEWCPEQIGEMVGCGTSAAGAYCRDARKPKFGAHSVFSRPGVYQGKRTSFYRLYTGQILSQEEK